MIVWVTHGMPKSNAPNFMLYGRKRTDNGGKTLSSYLRLYLFFLCLLVGESEKALQALTPSSGFGCRRYPVASRTQTAVSLYLCYIFCGVLLNFKYPLIIHVRPLNKKNLPLACSLCYRDASWQQLSAIFQNPPWFIAKRRRHVNNQNNRLDSEWILNPFKSDPSLCLCVKKNK